MIRLILLSLSLIMSPTWALSLEEAVSSPHRTEEFRARDQYRHPLETLDFFRIQPGQTLVEIWPGGGWYTEILAPVFHDEGTFYAAHFPRDTGIPYFQTSRKSFEEKLASDPEHYGNAQIVDFDPGSNMLSVPSDSVDRIVTFRNVHNWLQNDGEAAAFALFFQALKPGGMLGIVEHRSKPGVSRAWMLENGYMDEAYVIKLAEEAGFELIAESDINANSRDTADHPAGVWTLPPRLKLGAENQEAYLAIGESDRMTLLFRKPE